MLKRSPQLQSLQDKKKTYLKDACACDAMGKVIYDIKNREAHFRELAQKSSLFRMAANVLEVEIRGWQAGEERRGSCASQSNGCCFDSVMEQPFTWKRRMQGSRSKPCKRSSTEGMKFQPLLCIWQDEKKEEKRLERCRHTEQPVAKWVHQRQVGAMTALRLVLFMILLGTRMQTVNAVDEEISIRQERRTVETDLAPHFIRPAYHSNSLRRTKFSEGIEEKKEGHQKSKRKNSQVKEPRTFEGNIQGPKNL